KERRLHHLGQLCNLPRQHLSDEDLHHRLPNLVTYRLAQPLRKLINSGGLERAGKAARKVIDGDAEGINNVCLGVLNKLRQAANLFLCALDVILKATLCDLAADRATEQAAKQEANRPEQQATSNCAEASTRDRTAQNLLVLLNKPLALLLKTALVFLKLRPPPPSLTNCQNIFAD